MSKELKLVRIKLVDDRTLFHDKSILRPIDAINIFRKAIDGIDRELFCVLNLDVKGRVINLNVTSVGSLSECMVHPREVFKSSILSNASAIVAVHNHISGDLTPSECDKEVTKKLKKAGEVLGIKLVDHIIINDKSRAYYSSNMDKIECFPKDITIERDEER